MPGVDTIEALTSAAQAFDATPLGLQVDPDADAAVRESLQRTGIVLLGEAHGMAETPVLVEELIAWFGLDGIALEWHEDLRPWLDRWIADGVLTDPVWGSDLAGEVWGGDGRLTAGHLAALRRWAPSGVLITLMDGSTIMRPRPGETEEAMGRRWWSERDAAMAGRVLAAPDAPAAGLWWPVTCTPDSSRCQSMTPSAGRSASRWEESSLAGAPGCARLAVSTGPASSTTWAHAAAMSTTCVGSSWMGRS